MASIVQAEDDAEAGFVRRRSPTLRTTEKHVGQRKEPLPHVKNAGGEESTSVRRASSGGDGAGGDQGDDDEAQQHAVDEE